MKNNLKYKDEIVKALQRVKEYLEGSNFVGNNSVNFTAEDFYCGLLNAFYGWDLYNANKKTNNYPGADLLCDTYKIAVQITKEQTTKKVYHTIDEYKKKPLKDGYKTLYILMFSGKGSFPRVKFDKEVGEAFEFDKTKHIIDHSDLLKLLNDNSGDIAYLKRIYDYLVNQEWIIPLQNKPLNLWIISTTKDKIPTDLELTEEVAALHHESDPLLWRPFYQEAPISELLESYQSEVSFEVETRFLSVDTLTEAEELQYIKQLNQFVLILDGFAIDEQLKMIRRFNKNEIGGCIIPLCQSYPFAVFEYIRNRVHENLDDLHRFFKDFTDKYLHFVFPIPTKDLFFRTLTNLAIVHLAVSSKIEINETHETKAIRNQSFKF